MQSNLTIDNASILMLKRCFGTSIKEFETNDCVKMWLSENHNLATSNKKYQQIYKNISKKSFSDPRGIETPPDPPW